MPKAILTLYKIIPESIDFYRFLGDLSTGEMDVVVGGRIATSLFG